MDLVRFTKGTLAIEIFKTKNNLNPKFMKDIFMDKCDNGYNLRRKDELRTKNIKSVRNGEDTLMYLGSKIWRIIPEKIKKSVSLSQFKRLIRKWVPIDCPCRLCCTYIQNVGYIDRYVILILQYDLLFTNFSCILSL